MSEGDGSPSADTVPIVVIRPTSTKPRGILPIVLGVLGAVVLLLVVAAAVVLPALGRAVTDLVAQGTALAAAPASPGATTSPLAVPTPVAATPSSLPTNAPAPAAVTPTSSASSLAGHWSGEVLGDRSSYSLDVDLTDDGTVVSGRPSYPELGCLGSWQMVSRSADEIVFREAMPASSRCVELVTISLAIDPTGTTLGYSADSAGYQLTATLTRAEG